MQATSGILEAPQEQRERVVENPRLAASLRDYADLLEEQQANPFRARAYRKAAEVVERLPTPVSLILAQEGREGLDALPGVGPRIAAALAELSQTGGWSQLDRLRAATPPDALFRTVPGIGPRLAHRLADELHLSSLESLEAASHDGTLARAAGWGPRRLRMVQADLAERLGRRRKARRTASLGRPPVWLLLDVDREYRDRASRGALRKIAPKRMNPSGVAWLPILHTERGDWRFTALFSNTALSHQLGRTSDWVVIYYENDGSPEGQCTVVTETSGSRRGRRVVRGREDETPPARAPAEPARAVN